MKKTSGLVVCVLLLAGCYTEFSHRNRMMSDQYMPTDSLMASDSVRAHLPDTLNVNSNQVCYWTRDIYGQPQLRCDDSYYGKDWYRYNNSPWWNSSSSYYYGDYNSYGWDEPCPAYYYYDNTCGACRYYRDYQGQRDWWWDNPRRGSSSSYSPNATPSRTLHSRTEGIPIRADRVTGSPTSQANNKEAAKQAAGTSTIIGETGASEAAPVRTQRTRTEGIPESQEARDQQNANDAAVRDMNRRIEAERVQSERAQDVAPPSPPPSQGNVQESSPPPAPSQNTSSQQQGSGQDNQSGRDRHNTRGW